MSPQKGRPIVDPAVFELAMHMLSDMPTVTEADIWALARDIQAVCEDAAREIDDRIAGSAPQ